MVELRICDAHVFPGRVSCDHSYEESNQFSFIFRYGVLTLKTIEMALLTNSMILYRITWKNPNILAVVHWWLVVIKWNFTSCSKILVFNPLGETLSIVLFTNNKINMRNRNINATNIPWLNITNCHFSSGARFSRLPKGFPTRKAIAKFRTLCLQLWLQSCFIYIFFIYQERFSSYKKLIAWRGQNVSRALEKRASIGAINRNSVAVLRKYFTPTRVTFTVVYLMKYSDEMFVSF